MSIEADDNFSQRYTTIIYQDLRWSILRKPLSSLRRQFSLSRWYADCLHNEHKISLYPKFAIGTVIETEHLIIRDFLSKDAVGLLEYLSHPRVNCFVGDHLCSVKSAPAYISNSPKGVLRYAVCLKEDDSIIDDVFTSHEYTDTFSVGWHFNQRSEDKGLACEVTTELLDYPLHGNGAQRIYGSVEDNNLRSERLCEYFGMRHEGCMKEFTSFVCYPDDALRHKDTCIYVMLNKGQKSSKQRR